MLTTELSARIIQGLWLLWALCWLAAAWATKKRQIREPLRTRIRYQAVVTAGAAMMLIGLPPIAKADSDLFARGPVFDMICIAIVACGIGWALYARVALGRNWSGTVQLKQDHSLVQTGPYRFSRHPIYTGLVLAFLGLGAFLDRWLELPGVASIVIGFRMKIAREERVMLAAFGPAYEDYRRKVRMLIPFVW